MDSNKIQTKIVDCEQILMVNMVKLSLWANPSQPGL